MERNHDVAMSLCATAADSPAVKAILPLYILSLHFINSLFSLEKKKSKRTKRINLALVPIAVCTLLIIKDGYLRPKKKTTTTTRNALFFLSVLNREIGNERQNSQPQTVPSLVIFSLSFSLLSYQLLFVGLLRITSRYVMQLRMADLRLWQQLGSFFIVLSLVPTNLSTWWGYLTLFLPFSFFIECLLLEQSRRSYHFSLCFYSQRDPICCCRLVMGPSFSF